MNRMAAVVFQTLSMTEWDLARAKPSEAQLPSLPPQADRLPLDCPLQPISTFESAPEYL